MNWHMAPPLKNRERGLPSSLGSNSDALVVSVRSLTQYGPLQKPQTRAGGFCFERYWLSYEE
jgi:hypothetical protein